MCVLVEFPHSKVQLTGLPIGMFPILPPTWTFTTLLDCNRSQKKIRVTQHHIPIQLGYTVTGHSLQGKTLPKVIVNLHEGGFAAYVAASCARMREGLCITQPVSLQHLNKQIPTDLLLEVSRFNALEHNSLVAYGYHKGEPVVVPDAESEMGHGCRILMAHFEEEKEVRSRGNKRGLMSVSDGGDETK
jgi:hypothetical protein